MSRRVVITGLGAVTPIGVGADAYWTSLAHGVSGIRPFSRFDVNGFPIKAAAEVRDFDPRAFIPQKKALKVMAWDIQLAVAAAAMAVDDSRIITPEKRVAPDRLGCSFGAGLISTDIDEIAPTIMHSMDEQKQFKLLRFGTSVMADLFPLWLLKYLPNMPACHVSIFYDAQGPNNSLTTGDTASAQAIGEAFRIISRGKADVMICGGADAKLNLLSMVRYQLTGQANTEGGDAAKLSRPFDRKRAGFVVGEGAAAIVLEEVEHARRRGAKIYAELAGYGAGCDAWRVDTPHPEGRGTQVALKQVFRDSGLTPADVDAVFANARGTRDGDRAECRALHAVCGDLASKVPVTSTKSMLGYISAALGVLDVVAAVRALGEQVIPPTLNYEEPDPECPVNVVAGKAKEAKLRNVLVNTAGFGGQCAALMLRKCE